MFRWVEYLEEKSAGVADMERFLGGEVGLKPDLQRDAKLVGLWQEAHQ
jgi:hypothetical protein